MNEIKKMVQQRERLLLELGKRDRIVSGSFFARTMNGSTRFCLSSMQNGKQRQTYVAAQHADLVRRGVRQHARALEILSELGSINLRLIKKGAGDA